MVLHGLQHHLNALHVMARLVRLGLPRPRALALVRWWERVVHPLLYPVLRPLIPVCVASPWSGPQRRDARPGERKGLMTTTPLVQRMLECLFHDAGVRQTAKDALADWILDTQPRTRPLDPAPLVDYLACQHPELLARLKRNARLQAELTRPLDPR